LPDTGKYGKRNKMGVWEQGKKVHPRVKGGGGRRGPDGNHSHSLKPLKETYRFREEQLRKKEKKVGEKGDPKSRASEPVAPWEESDLGAGTVVIHGEKWQK